MLLKLLLERRKIQCLLHFPAGLGKGQQVEESDILVADTSALHHSELFKAELYGLHSLPVDGGREDKAFLIEIVGCTEYAVVHVASLLAVFLHALQYSHIDKSVGKKQTEELALHCLAL